MSELIQKITGDKAEMLIDKALKEGIITEDEANWDSLPYGEAAYHLRHVDPSTAREYLADQLDLAEALWMEGDEDELSEPEMSFLLGEEVVKSFEAINAHPVKWLDEEHLTTLWEAYDEIDVGETTYSVSKYYITDEDDEKIVEEMGGDWGAADFEFSHFKIEEP
jgi:hypothetical protein